MGFVGGFRAVGSTRSVRRYPAFIEDISALVGTEFVRRDGILDLTGPWDVGDQDINNLRRLGVGTAAPSDIVQVVGVLGDAISVVDATSVTTIGGGITGQVLTLGAGANLLTGLACAGTRAYMGYAGTFAFIQGGAGKGVEIRVNSAVFAGGTVAARFLSNGNILFGSNTEEEGTLQITGNPAATPVDTIGLGLINQVSASVGAQKYSPVLRQRGNGHETDGGTSMSVEFRRFVIPVQGAAAPTADLVWESSIDSAAYVEHMRLSSSGYFDFKSTAQAVGLPKIAGDPAAPLDGDIWYDTVSDTYQGRENGVTVTFTTT